MLGDSYSTQEDLTEAVKFYHRIIQMENSPETLDSTLNWLSQDLMKNQSLNEGPKISKAVKAINHIGSSFYQEEDFDSALQIFYKCLEIYQDNEDNYSNGLARGNECTIE